MKKEWIIEICPKCGKTDMWVDSYGIEHCQKCRFFGQSKRIMVIKK